MHVVVVHRVGAWIQHAQPGEQAGRSALGHRDGGGRQHGLVDLALVAGGHGDQRVGLFHAGGKDPARALEVERGAALADLVGQHGAGDGVPAESGKLLPVDAQGQRLIAVDPGA
ncbi:hypothetical protein D3C74_446540 [compost metagenome]